ncbi:C40 family peptidase [Solimonas flava]|uniref:C40 family peptidase n=1 Tax=Solimonas flava TaxID=415849 RepID=UPI00040C2C37|nr:C40 family peptidase [Solimonas flava]
MTARDGMRALRRAAATGPARRGLRRGAGDVIALLLGLAALGHGAHAKASKASAWPQIHDQALAMLGTAYGFGRNDDEAVDCSALMQRIFASAGVALPRTARELLHTGVPVARTRARAGDLLIYRWQPHQLHVALALDRTHIVHASPSAGEVVVAPLDAAWQRRLIAVRRVLKP